jgi:hypothetical protein
VVAIKSNAQITQRKLDILLVERGFCLEHHASSYSPPPYGDLPLL